MRRAGRIAVRKEFRFYLRQKRRAFAAAGSFCLIFLGSFALYHLPVAAVLYPAGLCVLFGSILLGLDYRRERKKYEKLQGIRGLSDVVSDVLPDSEGLCEEAYQEILRLLCEEQKEYRDGMEHRYSDMIDYYTIWAHQIKTPIASMRLTLQNEDSAAARRLSSDLFRIEQYVEMVLMFLRLDSDSSDYVIRETDLDMIVRQALRKFAGEFISRRIGLRYEPLGISAVTDEKWLSFVIEQVLSNALKYTPSGTIFITLERPKTLCIRDTGIGIVPEDLPRIFEKGYTGYHGREDKKASGLGLYLCRRICTNLGHRITAESAPDVGTTIRIDLEQTVLNTE
ncbi:MAG: sensor histidine kinase [Lachnospiraceae bacterium]|nr:sensor histidine kinase [Lachnospiraceae bacterium]